MKISSGVSVVGNEMAHVPVGTILLYAGGIIPEGWILCNGQSTTGYTALAAIVGANVPDINQKFIKGQSNTSNTHSAGNNSNFITADNAWANSTYNATGNAYMGHDHGTNWGGDHYHYISGGAGTNGPTNTSRGGNNVVNSAGQGHTHYVSGGANTNWAGQDHYHGVNASYSNHEHTNTHSHNLSLTYQDFRYIIKY